MLKKITGFLPARIYVPVLLSLTMWACIGVKPSMQKGGGGLYETFYVGDQGTQYFIKPLVLTDGSGQTAYIDFVFRYKTEVKDSATINISFFSNELIKKIDSVDLKSGTTAVRLTRLSHMFLERNGNKYNLRYTTRVPLASLHALFKNEKWELLAHASKTINYKSGSRTTKKIRKLNDYIFSLF